MIQAETSKRVILVVVIVIENVTTDAIRSTNCNDGKVVIQKRERRTCTRIIVSYFIYLFFVAII